MTPERRKLPEKIEQAIAKTTDNCWLITFILLLNSPGQFNSEEREKITTTTKEVLGINFWRTAGEVGKNFEALKAIASQPKSALNTYSQILNTIDRVISIPPPSQDQHSLLHLQQSVIKASFAGALYWLTYKNGGLETCHLFAHSPIAKVDHHEVWEKEIKVLTGIDRTVDEAAEVLKSFGISSDEAEKNLTKWFERFSAEVTNASLPRTVTKKEGKEIPRFLYRLIALSYIAASLSSSGTTKIDRQTLREALAQERPVGLSTGFGPIREEEEKQIEQGKWFEQAKTQTTIPSEIPPQITATGKDGKTGPAPEISIEKNEAFHVVEKGDSLSQIAKKYWNNGEISRQDLIRLTRALFMINPHLGNDPNKIEVGKRVFIYPDQMKGNFAEVLAATIDVAERKATEKEFQALIEKLSIQIIDQAKDLATAKDNGNWLLFRNDKGIAIEDLLEICYGNSDEMTLALVNRVNQMKVINKDVYQGFIILPPKGWLVFEIENCPLPPPIVTPKISTSREAQEKQPVPQTSPTPAVTTTEKNPAQETITYVVKQGDTLGSIAKQHRTTVDALVKENGILDPNKISVGRKLRIPGKEGVSAQTQTAETYYTVQKGDTLSAIGRRYNTTVDAIAQANGIANPNLIDVGQRLRIPGKDVSIKGVYKELPKDLEKYLGGRWATWEEIPEELRQWLTGIVVEETSVQRVPAWTILSIMSAEQLGGFRLTSRPSSASAIEPLGITPGWELTYFNTEQQRFDFRSQIEMVTKRLVEIGLTVDALKALGDEEFRKAFETYLCKHLAGEGRNCAPDSVDRNIPAAPGSKMKVQKYVDIGSRTAEGLVHSNTLQRDTKAIIAQKVVAATDQALGVTPSEEEARTAVGDQDPQAVVDGAKPLDEAVKVAVEKQVKAAGQELEKEVEKIVQGENASGPQDERKAPATLQTRSIAPPEPDKPKTEKPNIIALSKEELSRIQTSAQKSLCRPVPAEEIVAALKASGNDPEKAIQYFQSSPETTICQHAKESWKKATGKEPLTSQARVVAEEAMKVWGGQDPQTLNYTQIEAAKKRVEEILEVQKKESPQGSKVFDTEKEVRLPQVSRPYQSGNLKLRDTIDTRSGKLNDHEVHGNGDYAGVPSWLGQDFQTDSPDKTVVSPIDGVAESGWDPNAGYYISIRGTGIYEGLHVRIIHLAGKTTIGGQINRGQNIGQEGPQAHLHIITLWGDGGFNASAKDVPFSLLLPEDQKPKSKYQADNYIELYSLGNEYFNWFELK